MSNTKRFKGEWAATPVSKIIPGKKYFGNEFFDFCHRACHDDNLFKVFKKHPQFTTIVGSDVRGGHYAKSWLSTISNPRVQQLMPLFASGDNVGSPNLHEVEEVGSIATGTIYHASILNDIIDKIGDISNFKAVEIGPGYGGQAKVLLDYGVQHYTLIDVKPANDLQKKYLTGLGYSNVDFWDNNNIKQGQWDLVISNWCLSEFDKQGIGFYIKEIIQHCTYGYFLMNMWDEERKSFLLNELKKHFTTVETYDEIIKTHANKNWILVIKK